MPLYAHARIEDPTNPAKVWERGSEVSAKDASRLGLDPEYGAVSEEEYDASTDRNAPPDVIEIDGVRYTKEPSNEA